MAGAWPRAAFRALLGAAVAIWTIKAAMTSTPRMLKILFRIFNLFRPINLHCLPPVAWEINVGQTQNNLHDNTAPIGLATNSTLTPLPSCFPIMQRHAARRLAGCCFNQ
jgi:hypothetical protein